MAKPIINKGYRMKKMSIALLVIINIASYAADQVQGDSDLASELMGFSSFFVHTIENFTGKTGIWQILEQDGVDNALPPQIPLSDLPKYIKKDIDRYLTKTDHMIGIDYHFFCEFQRFCKKNNDDSQKDLREKEYERLLSYRNQYCRRRVKYTKKEDWSDLGSSSSMKDVNHLIAGSLFLEAFLFEKNQESASNEQLYNLMQVFDEYPLAVPCEDPVTFVRLEFIED